MGVPLEVGEVVLDTEVLDLLLQQVRFVQEEDDGDPREALVVDDGVEDVAGLHQPIGDAVLHQHLVELAGRRQEEDGRDLVEALEPLLPLRPLAADVHKAEGHAVDVDAVLVDALGRLTGVQDVLLLWVVILNREDIHKNVVKSHQA